MYDTQLLARFLICITYVRPLSTARCGEKRACNFGNRWIMPKRIVGWTYRRVQRQGTISPRRKFNSIIDSQTKLFGVLLPWPETPPSHPRCWGPERPSWSDREDSGTLRERNSSLYIGDSSSTRGSLNCVSFYASSTPFYTKQAPRGRTTKNDASDRLKQKFFKVKLKIRNVSVLKMHVLSWSEQNRKKQTRRRNHSKKIPRKPYTYMNEWVRMGRFKGSQRVMIKIWLQELLR